MGARLLYHSKVTLLHRRSEAIAIAELKVWQVPSNSHFPEGLKYSLFLVDKTSGEVLVGFDNHKPKGHHLHIDDREVPYSFVDLPTLVEDFWSHVQKRGFLV